MPESLFNKVAGLRKRNISSDVVMTSQCGPRRPNLNETKMRRRYDATRRVGNAWFLWL